MTRERIHFLNMARIDADHADFAREAARNCAEREAIERIIAGDATQQDWEIACAAIACA